MNIKAQATGQRGYWMAQKPHMDGKRKRAFLRDRDGSRCHICDKTTTDQWDASQGSRPFANPDYGTLEHVVPRSAPFYGTDTPANWVLLCRRCNSSKGATDMNEYLRKNGLRCACGKKCKVGKRLPKRFREMLDELDKWLEARREDLR